MTNPKTIYLQPECCADPSIGRVWCEDNEPESCDLGVPWTEYVLSTPLARNAGDLYTLLEELSSIACRCDGWESFPQDILDKVYNLFSDIEYQQRGNSHEHN